MSRPEAFTGIDPEIALAGNATNAANTGSDESVWARSGREAYVIGGGLLDGIKASAREAIQEPGRTLPTLAISAGIGATLAYAQGRAGLVKLGAEIAGLSFSVGMVRDLLDRDRLQSISTAVQNSWGSGADLEYNRGLIRDNAGQFVFNSGLMMAGGALGAGFTRAGALINEAGGSRFTANEFSGRPGQTYTLGATDASFRVSPASGADSFHPPLEVFPPETLTSGRRVPSLTGKTADASLSGTGEDRAVSWKQSDGKVWHWKPSEATTETLRDARAFVKSFMAQDYLGALKTAIEAPVMRQVELNPASRRHTVRFTASDLNEPGAFRALMSDLNRQAKFQWKQTIRDGDIEPQKLDVVVPKAMIELKEGHAIVPLVDFAHEEFSGYKVELPNRTADGQQLTAKQTQEISAIRQSAQGQRLIAEMGLMAFEESIVHANQHITAGGQIISPTYAEFARDFSIKHNTRAHKLSFLGLLERSHPLKEAFYEQEVPAVLYDAGMPLPLIERHYFAGAHHVQERAPVIEFLRQRK